MYHTLSRLSQCLVHETLFEIYGDSRENLFENLAVVISPISSTRGYSVFSQLHDTLVEALKRMLAILLQLTRVLER